jgi:membrane associated rhomboid family serine protease
VPLRDENPLRVIRWQWMTAGLIALNIVIFLLQLTEPGQAYGASFATIPVELLNSGIGAAHGRFDALAIPEPLTLITYQFLHGSPLHLVFYILCGIAGGLAHAVMTPASQIPLIGASGAVAGVIAAYLVLHPKVRVWVLAFRFIPLRISAMWVLGAWVITQFVMLFIPETGPVAWWAHIGGLIAGAVLIVFMRRPGVPLFDQV